MFPISELSDLQVAFGVGIEKIMPKMTAIPADFKSAGNKWTTIGIRWFFQGLPKGTTFHEKSGVDKAKALRHIKAVLGSFEPKHEHKQAAVGFLLSEWFEDIQLGE